MGIERDGGIERQERRVVRLREKTRVSTPSVRPFVWSPRTGDLREKVAERRSTTVILCFVPAKGKLAIERKELFRSAHVSRRLTFRPLRLDCDCEFLSADEIDVEHLERTTILCREFAGGKLDLIGFVDLLSRDMD